MTRWTLLLVAPLLAACPGSRTYEIRRSALVPHLVPALGDGRRPDGAVRVDGAYSTLAASTEPEPAPNDESGLYVALGSLALGGRVHLVRGLEVGPLFEVGLPGDALRSSDDMPARPPGPVLGFGTSFRYTIATEESPLSLGLGVDVIGYSIPFREEVACVGGCPSSAATTVDEGRHWVPVVNLVMMPSWTPIEALTVHAIFSFRNHPTNTARTVLVDETGEPEDGNDDDSEARPGPFNVVGGLGVSVRFDRRLGAFVNVTQSLNGAPLRYGPTLAGGLSVTLGNGPLVHRRKAAAEVPSGRLTGGS